MGGRTNKYRQYNNPCPLTEARPVIFSIRTKAPVKWTGQVVDKWTFDNAMKDQGKRNGHRKVEQEYTRNGMTEAAHCFSHMNEIGKIRSYAAGHQSGQGEPSLFSQVKRHGQRRMRKGEGHGQRKEEKEIGKLKS
jgi:hypothetical protein